jgi:hypothetical protein
MTGQQLLDRMELLDGELQLQSGEADVTRGLLALNVAQDYFETLAAQLTDFHGDSTGQLQTTANSETTAFPTGLLRLERLQLLDGDGGEVVSDILDAKAAGRHVWRRAWPFNLFTVSGAGAGKPALYTADGNVFRWSPIPDDTHYIRWSGFQQATDITANGLFVYEDIVALPVATFAVKLMALNKGDQPADYDQLAAQTFGPVLKTLGHFNRDLAPPPVYTRYHQT